MDRNQCGPSDSPQDDEAENAGCAQRQPGFDPAGCGQRLWLAREDDHIEVHPPADQDDDGDRSEDDGTSLGIAEEEDQEGNPPVEDQGEEQQRRPGLNRPPQEPGRFIRMVGVPDQQILTEPDIHPETAEAEQECPQIVQAILRHERPQWAVSAETDGQKSDSGQGAEKESGKVIYPENGAGPVRLQGHQPVVTGQPPGISKSDQEAGREASVAPCQSRIARLILTSGITDDQNGKSQPDGQVGQRSQQKEGTVEPHGAQGRVVLRGLG